jgi:5,10-methylenetetrahydrofolate reductase
MASERVDERTDRQQCPARRAQTVQGMSAPNTFALVVDDRIIVGVGTLGSAKALKWMSTHVPGIYVPEALLSRISRSNNQLLAAKQACIETVRALTQIEGVAGAHIMGHKNEHLLAEIITESAVGEQQTRAHSILRR